MCMSHAPRHLRLPRRGSAAVHPAEGALCAQVKLLQGEHVGKVRIEQFLVQAMEAPAPQAVSQVRCISRL